MKKEDNKIKEIEHFNKTVKTVLQANNFFINQKYLYHYTDIHGLEGIVKNNKLWLSERNYMNDINVNSLLRIILSSILTILKTGKEVF